MDLNIILTILGIIISIFFAPKIYKFSKKTWNTMKNKTKIKGNKNQNFNQQIGTQIINPSTNQLECAKCHIRNQQLQDGLCRRCLIIVKLSSLVREHEALSNMRRNYDQAIRWSTLNSEIPKLRGELEALNKS